MWSVIQTYDHVAGWELSAVPNNWLLANGKFVCWPTSKNKDIQLKLAMDPNSHPKSSWSKIECRMKRMNISSFEEADSLVDCMSGGSSSECSVGPLKKKQPQKLLTNKFQKFMKQPSNTTPHGKAGHLVSDLLESPVIQSQSSSALQSTTTSLIITPATTASSQLYNDQQNQLFKQPNNTPPHANVGHPVSELLEFHVTQPQSSFAPQSSTTSLITTPVPTALTQRLLYNNQQNGDNQYNGQNIDGIDASIAQSIFCELNKITKKLASQQTILEMLLNRSGVTHPGTSNDSIAKIDFNKVENKTQLGELDNKLEQETFKTNLMRMLHQNINMGRCGDDKMLAALDIICTKEFQAQCTWTGASRKGPKTAIMSHPKFVQLFIDIGSSETELINNEKVGMFFMKKLKNATKRMSATGQRRSSRHNVSKRSRSSAEENKSSKQNTLAEETESSDQEMEDREKAMFGFAEEILSGADTAEENNTNTNLINKQLNPQTFNLHV